MDADLLKYLPVMLPRAYQGMIYDVRTKKVPAYSTYKNLQTLEFNIKLPENQYMNWNSVHICLPIKVKSNTNEAKDIAANMITVNYSFAHWIKEIDIKRQEEDLQTFATNNPTVIYRYSGTILKHMPKDAFKT